MSLDLPCHGQDVRAGEPEGLRGWRTRLEQGEDPVARFTARILRRARYSPREGYADPGKVAVCGTSRGGFMAMHAAAADARVKCAAAFAPVTDLSALREFEGCADHPWSRPSRLPGSPHNSPGGRCGSASGTTTSGSERSTPSLLPAALWRRPSRRDRPANVELHVMPSLGHSIHATAHEEASAWLLAQMPTPG